MAKLENKLGKKRDESVKLARHVQAASRGASDRDALFPEYTSFDADGLPDKNPDGSEVSGSKKKSLKKELDKYRKESADFLAKGGLEYHARLASEIDELVVSMQAINK